MKLQRWARPKPGLARAPGTLAPSDRLLQFQELRRALAHLDMLMADMEQGDANHVAPIFARAAARLSRYADDFAGPEFGALSAKVGGDHEEAG